MSEHKAKDIHFTDCEIEILVGEIEARKQLLFGIHGAGHTNKMTFVEWEHVEESQVESRVKLPWAFSLKRRGYLCMCTSFMPNWHCQIGTIGACLVELSYLLLCPVRPGLLLMLPSCPFLPSCDQLIVVMLWFPILWLSAVLCFSLGCPSCLSTFS